MAFNVDLVRHGPSHLLVFKRLQTQLLLGQPAAEHNRSALHLEPWLPSGG
jgi:hypothetical protein